MDMLNVDIEGAGMPRGNKKAGFVGLMLAKKHLRRGVNDYNPPATDKITPARFNVGRIAQPSAYIQNVYGQRRQAPAQAPRPRGRPPKAVAERSARGRFLAGEREQLGEEKLAQLRETERLRAQKARDKRALAKINAMAEGEAKENAKRNFQLLQQSRGAGAMTGGYDLKKIVANLPQAQAQTKALNEARARGDVKAYMRIKRGGAMTGGASLGRLPSGDYAFDSHIGGAMTGGMSVAEWSAQEKARKEQRKAWKATATPEQLAIDQRLKQFGKTGGAMPKQTTFWEGAKASYQDPPPQSIADNFNIVFNTPTMDAYLNEGTKTILVAVRGTKPTDFKDLSADASLVVNGLSKTDRYKTDKASMDRLFQMFPPNQFEYYLTGHSLAGAVINSLKRDFPQLKNAEEYNPAFQPYDLWSQQTGSIHRNYINTDALYRLGGRMFGNTKVLPPISSSNAPSGIVGDVMTAYAGHALDQFKGRGLKGGMVGNNALYNFLKNNPFIMATIGALSSTALGLAVGLPRILDNTDPSGVALWLTSAGSAVGFGFLYQLLKSVLAPQQAQQVVELVQNPMVAIPVAPPVANQPRGRGKMVHRNLLNVLA